MQWLRILATLLVLIPTEIFAQAPNHAVPVGRGAGVSGYNYIGPCAFGVPIIGAGSSADPVCAATGSPTGLIVFPASQYATNAVLPNTPTYNNGTLGVGATLTAGSNAALVVDSASPSVNDIILVKNQTSGFQNGLYSVTAVGSGGAPWVLTRTTNFDQAAEMVAGAYTSIVAGTANANKAWVLQTSVGTVGTDTLLFNLFNNSATVPGGSARAVQFNNSGAFGGGNLFYTAGGLLGLGTSTPGGMFDIFNNTASNIQAILTHGVTDANFQLTAQNGLAGGSNTLQATLGLNYFGAGMGPMLQFVRGSSAQDGTLVINPNGNQVIVGPGLPPVGIVNVKGSVTPLGASSIVFYGEGYGSAGSLSNNAVTLILRDYSNSHSAAISIDAVNSAGALVQNAFEFNPGFVWWDAGHEQGDIDFNSFINGTLQGVMAWNAGCNVLNVGCSIPTNPALVGDGNGITDLGYTSRRWRSVNAAVLNLSNTTNTGYGIITSTITGTTYDSAGHQFLTGGVLVGAAPTGGNKGAGTINIAGDIYKNNTAYTNPDYVFEKYFTGKIERFNSNPGATSYTNTLSLDQAEAAARITLRLPGITDEPMGAFERSDKVLEKVEEVYLHMFELNGRLKKAEACLASWKCRLLGL